MTTSDNSAHSRDNLRRNRFTAFYAGAMFVVLLIAMLIALINAARDLAAGHSAAALVWALIGLCFIPLMVRYLASVDTRVRSSAAGRWARKYGRYVSYLQMVLALTLLVVYLAT